MLISSIHLQKLPNIDIVEKKAICMSEVEALEICVKLNVNEEGNFRSFNLINFDNLSFLQHSK
jgi:hypothetical protein